MEPLLSETPDHNRFVLYPIQHDDLWKMYKKAESAFWTVEEIDLAKDVDDWNGKLNDDERFFIKNVLAFFAASDGIVNENLANRFYREVMYPEARSFYGFQMAIEQIHCVSGDTLVLTDQGHVTIRDLVGRHVRVWNGHEFSRVLVAYTGDSPLYKVVLSDGTELSCTPRHKWFVADDQNRKIVVYTEDLRPRDVVMPFRLPLIDVPDPFFVKSPYIHGFACGRTRPPQIDLLVLHDKDEMDALEDLVEAVDGKYARLEASGAMVIELVTVLGQPPHVFVPVNYSLRTKLRWLEGLVDAVREGSGKNALVVTHPSGEFLTNVKHMLTTMGVRSTVKKDRSTLYVESGEVDELYRIGFRPRFFEHDVGSSSSSSDTVLPLWVQAIESVDDGKSFPTYCFEEPKRHSGVFNGVLTGQSEMYSLMIDTFVKNSKEKSDLFNGMDTIPSVRKKAEWAIRWIENEEAPFAMRLLAFAIVEGVFFSGAFCSIFWLKERGVMPGLTTSNEFISRDEGLHTEFAVMLYTQHLKNKLPQATVHDIMREAVDIEVQFITESLPCRLLGMNSDLMATYIKFVADRLLVQLGYERMYDARNPFPFMARINLDHKTNFFEGRESNYAKANVSTTTNANEKGGAFDFTTDVEF